MRENRHDQERAPRPEETSHEVAEPAKEDAEAEGPGEQSKEEVNHAGRSHLRLRCLRRGDRRPARRVGWREPRIRRRLPGVLSSERDPR